MVDIIEFFRLFKFSTWGEGSKWSIFIDFFSTFDFSTLGGRSRWSMLLIFFDFLTFRPGGKGLNSQFY